MSGPTPVPIIPDPQFIEGPSGPLFTVTYAPPDAGSGTAPGALILPPFAEEMNRSRRMMALLGRALAARGMTATVLDLYGTGDSAGDFAEARWDIWLRDAAAARDWLSTRVQGGLSYIGIRLGACLALELASQAPAPERLVLWSPVLRGDQMINQFLRVRALAGIGQTGGQSGPKESAKDLRERLRGGEVLEIAGYALHPELAAAIEGLRLAELAAGCPSPLAWMELAGEAGAAPSPAVAQALETVQGAGAAIEFDTLAGDPYWSIEETVVVEALVARTTALWPQ